ncbi:MAG TPA: thioredoxin family protein [Planctomycetota bacterium]|nr:thioredoxin family protein [Planctomycetota bacterium]
MQAAPPAPPAAPVPVQTPPAAKGDGAKSKSVYDEKADAHADVKAALAVAKRENKRVLIQWGANWCGWCLKLHGLLASDPELAKKVLYEYEVVHVDIGQFDKNMDLAKELGADFRGVPYLTILDATGDALVQQPTDPFEVDEAGKHGHDPKKVLDFLTFWQADYLNAAELESGSLKEAKASGKRVFLHYGAPWCGYCRLLERWMAKPEVAALLAKDFVDLKVDVDRTIGGKEAFAAQLARAEPKVADPAGFSIPWIVFLDGDGKQLAVGHTEKGNIGCPAELGEIDHFMAMLGKARVHLTDDDVAALKASLLEHTKAARANAANAGH